MAVARFPEDAKGMSISFANDSTPRAWFSLLTPEDGRLRIEHRALDHDWAGAAAAMREAGLTEDYASALGTGLWPSLDVLPGPERARTGMPIEPNSILW